MGQGSKIFKKSIISS